MVSNSDFAYRVSRADAYTDAAGNKIPAGALKTRLVLGDNARFYVAIKVVQSNAIRDQIWEIFEKLKNLLKSIFRVNPSYIGVNQGEQRIYVNLNSLTGRLHLTVNQIKKALEENRLFNLLNEQVNALTPHVEVQPEESPLYPQKKEEIAVSPLSKKNLKEQQQRLTSELKLSIRWGRKDDFVNTIKEINRLNLELPDEVGTPLHCIAKVGKSSHFIRILKEEYGVNFAIQDKMWGNTALMWAIANGHNTTALEMIKQGGSEGINLQDTLPRHHNSALHLAVGKGYKKNGKTFNEQNVTVSNFELVQAMVEAGADLNIQNANGNTPLHLAMLRRDYETIEYLIKIKARLDIRNEKGETPADMLEKGEESARGILKSTVAVFLLDKTEYESEANLAKIKALMS